MTRVLSPAHLRGMRALLALGWVIALAALAGWLRFPASDLRQQLRVLQFWSLEICFGLLVVLGVLALRGVHNSLGRADIRRMTGLAAAALALTLFVPPHTNRIYYDEHIYQAVGQNLADLKLAQMCNDGTVEYGRLQCWKGEYNKQPYAYPHVLSILYRIFGVHEWIAFAFNAGVIAATVSAIYLLVTVAFGDPTAAFFSALAMMLMPEQILWSATAAVEPSASLACVIAVLFAFLYARTRTTVALAATGVSVAYAVQFRIESLVILIPVALVVFATLVREDVLGLRLWSIGLLVLALVAVHVGHLFAIRNEGWGATEARMSLRYVVGNLGINGRFYLWDERFPVVVTILAVVGLASGPYLWRRLAFVLYFLLFFLAYVPFYAGSYNYGADVRYSLMTFPPIAVLAGLGVSALVRRLKAWQARARATRWMATALAAQFLWYIPLVRATTEEAWAARADVRFAKSLVQDVGAHGYVLTQNPGIFHLWGVNAGQMSTIVDNPMELQFLRTRYPAVYLHWNFWCNVQDVVQQRICVEALAGKPVEQVREYRERDQRFALYRFKGLFDSRK